MKADWPRYFKDRLWVGDAQSGFVGMATLWTPTEMFYKAIPNKLRKNIAVVGQLHTKRGIEYIFRNVWLNPKIRCIVLCGRDGCGAGDGLVEFCKSGQIQSSFFEQVDRKYIDKFRSGVEVVDMRGRSVDEVISKACGLKKKEAFSKKTKLFKDTAVKASNQSESSVFRVSAETIGEGWLQVLKLIQKFGKKIPRIHVYGGYERMLFNMAVIISNEDIAKPKIWPFFRFSKEDLRGYFRNFFTADRGEEAYTYGERMFAYEVGGEKIDQVTIMTKKLKSFEYNKGAVVCLWQPEIDNFPIRKPWRVPCLVLVEGMCMEGKFFLTATFRSNDMYGAWPQNAFALRKMQAEIAKRIGKKIGDLTIISHCAFVDENDMGEISNLIDKNPMVFCQFDPRGNVLVETDEKEIVVKHTTTDGELIKEYRQKVGGEKTVEKLIDVLVNGNVLSRVDHGMDVGVQLARAEMAIKMNLKFEQDKNIG